MAVWTLPTAHGTVTFSVWSFTYYDSEAIGSSLNYNKNILTNSPGSVGNPSPGDADIYWKSNNLPSGYYTGSLDVVIQSCVSSCSSATLTLVIPYIQG
jgi:hypothetical protein